MTILQQKNHIINNLFQRFDTARNRIIILFKSFHSQTKNLFDGISKNIHLLPGLLRKMNIRIMQFLGHLIKICRIIADTLNIMDTLHQHISLTVVGFRLNISGQFDKIIIHTVRKLIQSILTCKNLLRPFICIFHELKKTSFNILFCHFCHDHHAVGNLIKSNCRNRHQLPVKCCHFRINIRLNNIVFNNSACNINKHSGKRQKHNRCHKVEQCLEIRNSAAVYHTSP